MKDLQTHLEKLRTDAAECHLLSSLAADPVNREVFAKLGEHINGLASETEKVFEPEKPTTEENVPAAAVFRMERTTASEPSDAARPRHKFPWLKVTTFVFVAVAGASFANNRAAEHSTAVVALQSRPEPSPAPRDDTKEITALLSAKQERPDLVSDRVDALAARVDNLEGARAEIPQPTTLDDQLKEEVPSSSAETARSARADRSAARHRHRSHRYTHARYYRDRSFAAWVFPNLFNRRSWR
jgi:hypothetical protein